MLRDLDCKNAKGRDKAYKLADSHGLYLWITPTCVRSWRWDYRFQGKAGTHVFGRYPELSLQDVRLQRAELDKLRREGMDPKTARKLAKSSQRDEQASTFEVVARQWHAQQKTRLTERHANNIISKLEREVFPHFGRLDMKDVKSSMVLAALKPLIERGAIDWAHRTRQFISSIFDFAISSDLAEHDPAAKVKGALPPKKYGRHPALRTVEEARALLQAVETEHAYPPTKLVS